MDYKTYMTEAKTEDRIAMLYSNIMNLLKENEQINETAMVLLQSMGYNGFKRWHRYRSRQFHEYVIRLNNELFDRFHKTLKMEPVSVTYTPASMNSHLMSWKEKLDESMQKLSTYSKEYFDLVGMENKVVRCAMHTLARDYEKVCRYYERFAEGDWLAHDMHVVDDMIHYRYKKKEEKHGYRY